MSTSRQSRPVLLTIEDDPLVRTSLALYLSDRGYRVLEAGDGRTGIELFHAHQPEIVLLDLRLPKVDGLEVLKAIHSASPDTPVIIVSGMGTLDDVITAMRNGAWDYVRKPITDMDLLSMSIERALVQLRLKQENEQYRKHLEEEIEKRTIELQQAQKVEAIGTLAGGIAHDFNNILGVILGYTELSLMDDDPGRIRENLIQIQQAGHRATDLVRQLLTFSRKKRGERQPCSIVPIVKEAAKMLSASLPATVEIKTRIQAGQEMVMADPTEIHQVIMNLCTNGFHAMPEERGILEIELEPCRLQQPLTASRGELGAGEYLRLRVRDNGRGIPDTAMTRIFDPFFTTKEPGKGTGLGLAVVDSIVTGCGGGIRVESRPGHGTTMDCYFPVIDRGPAQRPDDEHREPVHGKGEILLIDDDPALAELGRNMLTWLGYTVTAKTSGLLGLETFRKDPDRFDLVITDQTMRGLPGTELIRLLREIRPDLPVILCTGYSSVISPEKLEELGVNRFLMKPLTLSVLSRTVARILKQEPSPSHRS